MIYCLVGRPGTGKTYSLVKIAYNAVISGVNVYSNFFINFDSLLQVRKKRLEYVKSIFIFLHFNFFVRICDKALNFGKVYFWHELSDFINLKQGIILMDEAQIYINSREYKFLPTSVQYKFQQHRKHGLDLFLAVQNIRRIDIVARELVNSVFEFKRIGKFFLMHEYDIEEIDKVKRSSYSSKFYRLKKSLALCYDTMQEISKDDKIETKSKFPQNFDFVSSKSNKGRY